jgi:hypothetical protein
LLVYSVDINSIYCDSSVDWANHFQGSASSQSFGYLSGIVQVLLHRYDDLVDINGIIDNSQMIEGLWNSNGFTPTPRCLHINNSLCTATPDQYTECLYGSC